MKTSIVLLVAIFLNTTMLLAEPLSLLLDDVNIWLLIVLEAMLLLGYYLHKTIRELRKALELDLSDLNIFVVKDRSKRFNE